MAKFDSVAHSIRKSKRWPTAVDLFCGCGGVTEGLKKKHFKVVAAVEKDPVAASTYRANHPRVKLFEQDISEVSPTRIRREILSNRNLDVLVVCAPCQPFSSQNRNATLNEERATLIFESIRFARILKPKIVFFENVPGLLSAKNSKILSKLKTSFEDLGYQLGQPTLVDAADFCVPQRRRRCIMIASHNGQPPEIPEPTSPEGSRVLVKNVLQDLPSLRSGQRNKEDPMHFAREHRPIAIERLKHIPKDGGSRFSLPARLRLACHTEQNVYPDVYGRMSWNDVAPTLTTGCTDITRGRFAHPSANRSISLREAARLQSFDDTYQFKGSPKDIAIQIGNAVPVRLIAELSDTFRKALV